MSTVEAPTSSPEAGAAQLILQVATGHIVASALRCALIFGIPDRVANGPRAVAELARESGAHEESLYRVLRALASIGVFEETAPRTFGPTAASRMLTDAPGSLRGLARWISDGAPMRAHAEMEYSVRTGRPAADKVYGKPVFEYFAEQPEISEVFNDGMTSFSSMVIPAVLEAYDFGDIRTLVDVGGGHGYVLSSILQRYPQMRGILCEIEHVAAGARARIAGLGLADRCEVIAGDFFGDVPTGDAFIMKHIIHDWDDERAAAILLNIRRRFADPANGRVLLLESVIQPGSAPDPGKVVDLEMLVMAGGRERTAEDFAALFVRAGLMLTRIVPTHSPLSVIEARTA